MQTVRELTKDKTMSTEFYIIDMRPEWRGNRMITLWKGENAGYTYSVNHAGKYSEDDVAKSPCYYSKQDVRGLMRFPVPCAFVDELTVPSQPFSDSYTGPVLLNNKGTREALLKHGEYWVSEHAKGESD